MPGVEVHVGDGGSDLTFKLTDDKQHVVIEKTVTAYIDNNSTYSSDSGYENGGVQQKRTLKLIKEQVDEMIEDVTILEDAIDYLHHESPVTLREIYYGDFHVIIDNSQSPNDKNVELRRFYMKDGRWERTRYGINMKYREFGKVLKMMEKSAPFMVQLQRKKLQSRRKNRYQ